MKVIFKQWPAVSSSEWPHAHLCPALVKAFPFSRNLSSKYYSRPRGSKNQDSLMANNSQNEQQYSLPLCRNPPRSLLHSGGKKKIPWRLHRSTINGPCAVSGAIFSFSRTLKWLSSWPWTGRFSSQKTSAKNSDQTQTLVRTTLSVVAAMSTFTSV